MTETQDIQVERNFRFFQALLPDLVQHHRDRYALLRNEEIVGIYDTLIDAKTTGDKFYSDGLFSIQKIENTPVDLGFFSHAMHLGTAQ